MLNKLKEIKQKYGWIKIIGMLFIIYIAIMIFITVVFYNPSSPLSVLSEEEKLASLAKTASYEKELENNQKELAKADSEKIKSAEYIKKEQDEKDTVLSIIVNQVGWNYDLRLQKKSLLITADITNNNKDYTITSSKITCHTPRGGGLTHNLTTTFVNKEIQPGKTLKVDWRKMEYKVDEDAEDFICNIEINSYYKVETKKFKDLNCGKTKGYKSEISRDFKEQDGIKWYMLNITYITKKPDIMIADKALRECLAKSIELDDKYDIGTGAWFRPIAKDKNNDELMRLYDFGLHLSYQIEDKKIAIRELRLAK